MPKRGGPQDISRIRHRRLLADNVILDTDVNPCTSEVSQLSVGVVHLRALVEISLGWARPKIENTKMYYTHASHVERDIAASFCRLQWNPMHRLSGSGYRERKAGKNSYCAHI